MLEISSASVQGGPLCQISPLRILNLSTR
uniref:Uncharacterized protein n=1 Tax=Anguilla anguilla TaxID=7936 RepID=A0A0E9RK75_ANGAN